MKKIIIFIMLYLLLCGNTIAKTLSLSEIMNIESQAEMFSKNTDIEKWQSQLFIFDRNKYYDMCGEAGNIPKKGFSQYCEFYYTFSFAKEKSFKSNIKNKYKKIQDSLYDISNNENELFNDFYLNYNEDKIMGNNILEYVNKCDSYYEDKNRSNQCIVALATKSKNPFNIGIAYCFYKDSRIESIDPAGKYLYRKINQNEAQNCFNEYISQNKEYFLKWELYIGYKTGLSLSEYVNDNNLFDFTLKYQK